MSSLTPSIDLTLIASIFALSLQQRHDGLIRRNSLERKYSQLHLRFFFGIDRNVVTFSFHYFTAGALTIIRHDFLLFPIIISQCPDTSSCKCISLASPPSYIYLNHSLFGAIIPDFNLRRNLDPELTRTVAAPLDHRKYLVHRGPAL